MILIWVYFLFQSLLKPFPCSDSDEEPVLKHPRLVGPADDEIQKPITCVQRLLSYAGNTSSDDSFSEVSIHRSSLVVFSDRDPHSNFLVEQVSSNSHCLVLHGKPWILTFWMPAWSHQRIGYLPLLLLPYIKSVYTKRIMPEWGKNKPLARLLQTRLRVLYTCEYMEIKLNFLVLISFLRHSLTASMTDFFLLIIR